MLKSCCPQGRHHKFTSIIINSLTSGCLVGKAKIMKTLYKLEKEQLESGKKSKINIFLTQEEHKKLIDIKNKYHISISTIVSIICQEYSILQLVIDKASQGRILKQEKGNRKTSIKPVKMFEDKKAVFYENLIHIFCNEDVKNMYPQKIYEKNKNNIYNRFEITQDPMYDYNEFIRKAWVYDKYRRKAEL